MAGPWVDLVTVLATLTVFFGFGWVLFARVLFQDYEVRERRAQTLFALTFTLSCSMFELIIFEIVGVLAPDSRWWNWKFDLYALLFLLIFVLPINMIHLFSTSVSASHRKAWTLTSCLFLVTTIRTTTTKNK
jgi:hypothetical protein